MARVVMQAVVSVDGCIAYPDDTVGPLFDWYGNGDSEVSARPSGWTFSVSRASAGYVQPFWDAIAVTVPPVRHDERLGRQAGRRGWLGRRHPPAAARRVARGPPGGAVPHRRLGRGGHRAGQDLAGDGLVCVTAGDVGGQAISAGLVDEVAMDVVPVVQGDRVLHLHHTVRR